jgi:hypothetical protein
MDIDIQPFYKDEYNSFVDDNDYSNFSLRGKKYWADVRAKEAEAAAKSAEATRLLAQARAVEQAAADASLIALENAKKAASESAAAEAQRILAEKKTETGTITADVELKAAEVKSATDIKQAELTTQALQTDVAGQKTKQTAIYIGGALIIVAIFYYISKK